MRVKCVKRTQFTVVLLGLEKKPRLGIYSPNVLIRTRRYEYTLLKIADLKTIVR